MLPSGFDREGNPITLEEAARLLGDADSRLVDYAYLREQDIRVSTVHMPLDMGGGMIFETMVFGGEHDQEQWRYATEDEARVGHAAVVAWVAGDGPEPQMG